MIPEIIRSKVLKNFFRIPLSTFEKGMADDAVDQKYAVAVVSSCWYSIALVPALFLLDTAIVISVLLPTTMVAGTAWFSVSLASMKQKFENFGMELTRDLFVAFTLSLMMLFLSALTSLTQPFWESFVAPIREDYPLLSLIAAALAMLVVGKLLFSIFAGSLKYDVNDAMLTGQNEAAEKFFKTSLSVLHATSNSLQENRELQVANYSLGVAFFEVFESLKRRTMDLGSTAKRPSEEPQNVQPTADKLKDISNLLVETPSMPQSAADAITRRLVRSFLQACGDNATHHKSFQAVEFELGCLERNSKRDHAKGPDEKYLDPLVEDQEMVDLRMSVVLKEIATLIEEYGHQIDLAKVEEVEELVSWAKDLVASSLSRSKEENVVA